MASIYLYDDMYYSKCIIDQGVVDVVASSPFSVMYVNNSKNKKNWDATPIIVSPNTIKYMLSFSFIFIIYVFFVTMFLF